MKKIFLFYFIFLTNFVYSDCNNYSIEIDCIINNNCEWIEDITNWNCSSFGNSSTCENYSEYGCSWEFSWGGWQNYGSSCVGGTFQIDNGYCQELEIPECSDYLTQSNCDHIDECVWVDDDFDCTNIMNTEISCISNNCNWIEDVEYGNCSDWIYNYSQCNSIDECSWSSYQIDCGTGTGYEDCVSQTGCSYSWLTYQCSGLTTISDCSGGIYQIDNSYCDGESGYCDQDLLINLGDVNYDGIINVQDIIQVIYLILNLEYNENGDMNSDGIINVLDIVDIIQIILNN